MSTFRQELGIGKNFSFQRAQLQLDICSVLPSPITFMPFSFSVALTISGTFTSETLNNIQI